MRPLVLALSLIAFAAQLAGCAHHPRPTPGSPPQSGSGRFAWTCDEHERCDVVAIMLSGERRGVISGFNQSPRVRQLDARISEVQMGCGAGCTVAFFADFRTDRLAGPFVNVIAAEPAHELVAIAIEPAIEPASIRIIRMFGSPDVWLTVARNFAPGATLANAIEHAEFIDGRVLSLTYFGPKFVRSVERVQLDIGRLPPVEPPVPTPQVQCCIPLARLSERQIVRHIQQTKPFWDVIASEGIIPAGQYCAVVDDPHEWSKMREQAWLSVRPARAEAPAFRVEGTRATGTPMQWTFARATRTWVGPDGTPSAEPPPQCVAALARVISRRDSSSLTFWLWTEEVEPRYRRAGVPANGGAVQFSKVGDIKVTSMTINADGTVTAVYQERVRPTRLGYATGMTKANERVFVGTAMFRKEADGWHYTNGGVALAQDVNQRQQRQAQSGQPQAPQK